MSRLTSPRRTRGPQRGRRNRFLLLAGAALGMAACTQPYPQNTLAPAGPTAQKQAGLFFLVFWIAVGVFVVVEGLLLFAMIRFREKPGRETPVQVHGNTRLEVAWTIVPALLLAGVAFPTLATIFELAQRPRDPAVVVDVTGHKWWWEVKYPEQQVVTANEIHIPTGQPVLVRLTSDELVDQAGLPVIHSFWVPRLAGKQDVVPGRVNEILIEADQPGTYLGQCAEYCGLSHYNMRFRVIADEPADFDAWIRAQRADAATPAPGTDAADGEQVFADALPQGPPPGSAFSGCFGCHTVRGVEQAVGTFGPDLTHVGSRQTIAAGILPNNPEGLVEWLHDPPEIKPGSKMPDYQLTDEQIEDLVAYLRSLK